MKIVAGIILILLLMAMALLVIYPIFYIIVVDDYYFKVRYSSITGHSHTEYFSVQAVSLKRAYKKARYYVNESCMSHEYIDYISLI